VIFCAVRKPLKPGKSFHGKHYECDDGRHHVEDDGVQDKNARVSLPPSLMFSASLFPPPAFIPMRQRRMFTPPPTSPLHCTPCSVEPSFVARFIHPPYSYLP
jgi:hypothetical protein